ncbi:MAG: class I SAM-dependent methyltransferase [Candidatus Peribacteraceae bacterium]|nr:class I SAM-dependent methyltransferase [Candidatus Peribacteraceae bacterium]
MCNDYTESIPLIAFFLFGLICIALFFLVVTVAGNLWTGVPSLPIAGTTARAMVEFSALRGDETVYDLGAGDGRILLAAKQMHPRIHAAGWEILPTLWCVGILRRWWSGLHISLHLGDALHQDLSSVDCIYLYLFPSLMKRLEEKFDHELKPGTKVVSAVFRFYHHQPVAQRTVRWLGSSQLLWLYVW